MKRKITLTIIGILILIIISLSITYAFMRSQVQENQTETNINIKACAKIQLKDNGTSINLENTFPIDDDMGLETEPYEFTVSSTCEEYVGFNLYLTSLNDNQIEDNNIHFAITNPNKDILKEGILSNQENGLNDFDDEEINQLDIGIKGNHKNIYKVYSNSIPFQGERSYQLYLWLDKDASNETMGQTFRAGVSINAYERENNLAVDLSGNGFDGEFKNGAIIKKDEENNVGLYLDGEDDYVDIVDLPESINWDGGFTVEFEARWLKFNKWSRIFDFGNGEYNDNIFIANSNITNNFNFDSRYGTEVTRGSTTVTDSIVLNEYEKYKVEVIKNIDYYTHNIYKDNSLILSKTYNVTSYVRNVNRNSNFLGKSNWDIDGYFNGFIYYLKFTDANHNVILHYDFSK